MYQTFRTVLVLFFFVMGPAFLAKAQQLRHVQGELLVRLKKAHQPQDMLHQYRSFRGRYTQVEVNRRLSDVHNIWSLRFDWTHIHETKFLEQIRRDPAVDAAQFNHILELRAIPNDPFYDLQWFFNGQGQAGGPSGVDIGAELAWDITTGGTTPAGDSIVLCVLDNGLEFTHEDIAPNLWRNQGEVPNNGIDDDNNGYVDDYHGWNSAERNGDISSDNFHGTRVTGVLGAAGNNGLGTAGLNWNVQVMTIRAFLGQLVESRIIEGYDYVLKQRRRYNESNGTEGAYVVATNSSWGFSSAFEEDAPLWCAIYDTLGQAGILNIVATENADVNVDEEGDLPALCSSPYVVAVTSTGRDGAKLDRAGYGASAIDLAAPGIDIYTTAIGNGYQYDAGSSMATPMVTGAVGLLYASPCPSLSLLARSDPGAAALLAKDLLLRSVVVDPSLEGTTVSGGRLNVYEALLLLESECATCFSPLSVQVLERTESVLELAWVLGDDVQRLDMRYRQEGTTTWTTLTDVGTNYRFTGLPGCTTYEVQFNAICSETTTGFGDSFIFETDGCCEPPGNIQFDFIGTTDVLLSWESVLAAQTYIIRYRQTGIDTSWSERVSFGNAAGLRELTPCTEYEMQFQVDCADGPSAFGERLVFSTRGCGACLEAGYCDASILDFDNSALEWIARVQLGDLDNVSEGSGYADYTSLGDVRVGRGRSYTMRVEPGFDGITSGEYILAWIDFNQDGLFTSGEIILDTEGTTEEPFEQELTVPSNAILGSTRMRIVMQFRDKPGACSFSSANFFGEVEDYCVNVADFSNSTASRQELAAAVRIFPNPTKGPVTVDLDFSEPYSEVALELFDLNGRQLSQQLLQNVPTGPLRTQVDISSWPAGVYSLRIRAGSRFLQKRLVIFE